MIYTNGCSFTFGDELNDPSLAWPYVLANKLNTNVVNDAVSGASNYRTVYQTIKNLNKNFDLYIIAWTTTTRYTFYKSDNNFEVNFNPQLAHSLYGNKDFYSLWGRTLYQNWHNELYAFKIWLQQIIQLQSVLEKFKKNYIMINTSENSLKKWSAPKDCFVDSVKHMINFEIMSDEQLFTEYEEIQQYLNNIDIEKFYQWNKFSVQDLTSLYPIGPNGHILEAGHQHLADLLFEYINV